MDPNFPLLDLHHHLDGSVRIETILDLGRQHNLPLPAWDIEGLRPYVQVTEPQPGLLAFFTYFKWMTGVLVNYDACRRVAYENVEDAHKDGVDYIELRFSPFFMAEANQLDPTGLMEAVVQGVQDGVRDTGVKANIIGILSRHLGVETAWKELDAILSQHHHVAAIDLAGDEANYPGSWFVDHIRKARESGLDVTIHAGEADGPESVWQALRELETRRLGHATRAIEDPDLVEYMSENHIGVEISLTSNVQTETVPDYASHPLRHYLEKGILATINTDDPGISAIDLPYEYAVAAPAAGLTHEQIIQAQHNALEIAFLSSAEKEELLKRKRA